MRAVARRREMGSYGDAVGDGWNTCAYRTRCMDDGAEYGGMAAACCIWYPS